MIQRFTSVLDGIADAARTWTPSPTNSCRRSSRVFVRVALARSRCGGDGWRVRLRRDGPPPGVGGPAPSRPSRSRGRRRSRQRRLSPAVGYFSPSPISPSGSSVQAGDVLGTIDVLGIAQDVIAPGRRHRQSYPRRGSARPSSTDRRSPDIDSARASISAHAGATAAGRLMVERVLIANRGEIAVRILRACRSMGLEAVVAHSEADASRGAVRMADESICIGPAESARSYLSAASVISAASGERLRCHPSRLRFPLRGRCLRRDDASPRPHLHRPLSRGPRAFRLEGGHA